MRKEEEDIARLLKKSLPSAQQAEEAGKRRVLQTSFVANRRLDSLCGLTTMEVISVGNRVPDSRWQLPSPRRLPLLSSLSFWRAVYGEPLKQVIHTEPAGDPIRSANLLG